jgi:hypothetical protein
VAGPSPQVRWTGLPPGSAPPAGRDDGGPRQAHPYPDCRTAGATADLGKVTQLVDHPQAVIVPVRAGPEPGQRIGDLALVVELAHDLISGVPQPGGPGTRSVTQRVSGQLAYRDHQVSYPVRSQPGAAGLAGHPLPELAQVGIVLIRLRSRRWRRQRGVAPRRDSRAKVRAVRLRLAFSQQVGMSTPDLIMHVSRQLPRVIRAQDGRGSSGERLVDQRLMPAYFACLIRRASRPHRLTHEPDPLVRVPIQECPDRRDDPGRVQAKHGHIGEGDVVAIAAECSPQCLLPMPRHRRQDWLAAVQATRMKETTSFRYFWWLAWSNAR